MYSKDRRGVCGVWWGISGRRCPVSESPGHRRGNVVFESLRAIDVDRFTIRVCPCGMRLARRLFGLFGLT